MSVPIRPLLRPAAALPTLVAVGVLLAALVVSAPSAASGSRWLWPLAEPHPVVRAFEAPSSPYGPGHRGIDIGGSAGTVRAVEDGTVHFAGTVAGRPVLSIRHRDGLLSTYEPVVAQVAVGEHVRAGHVIGHLDEAATSASHCAPELCLHLGARRGEQYLDPVLLLEGRGPSVLLPLAGGSSGGTSGADQPARTGTRADTGTGTGTGTATGTGTGTDTAAKARTSPRRRCRSRPRWGWSPPCSAWSPAGGRCSAPPTPPSSPQ